MFPAGFEFFANKADPIKIDSHGKLFIFCLDFTVARTLLSECLVIHGQRKHNVCAYFPGMQFTVEATKFNGVVPMEEAM